MFVPEMNSANPFPTGRRPSVPAVSLSGAR
jgi:hypothetical protein